MDDKIALEDKYNSNVTFVENCITNEQISEKIIQKLYNEYDKLSIAVMVNKIFNIA